MKTISFRSLLTLTLVLISLVSLQAVNEKGNTQTRNIASFHGISVSSGIDLYLTQGKLEEVIIQADTDVIDDIITKVEDGILHIYMEKTHHWVWIKERKAYVTFDDLSKLVVSSGSDAESENSFKLDEIEIVVSSGADLEIDDLRAEFVSLDTSSGSDAELSGRVVNFEASCSSGSDLSCSDLIAENCTVSASSGADAEVHATKRLKASASSGGDVRYKGNPQEKDIDESSGGDVSRN